MVQATATERWPWKHTKISFCKFKKRIITIDVLDKAKLELVVYDIIKKYETNFKGVGQPLRVALTGSRFGPGLYDIIISLGKEEVKKRLGSKIVT